MEMASGMSDPTEAGEEAAMDEEARVAQVY